MSLLGDAKQKIQEVIKRVDGEAEKLLREALATAHEAQQRVAQAADELKPAIDAAIASAEPAVQAAVSQVLQEFLAVVEAALSGKEPAQESDSDGEAPKPA